MTLADICTFSAVPSFRDDGYLDAVETRARLDGARPTATHLACPTPQGRAVKAMLPDRATDYSRSWSFWLIIQYFCFIHHGSLQTVAICNVIHVLFYLKTWHPRNTAAFAPTPLLASWPTRPFILKSNYDGHHQNVSPAGYIFNLILFTNFQSITSLQAGKDVWRQNSTANISSWRNCKEAKKLEGREWHQGLVSIRALRRPFQIGPWFVER